MNKTRQIIASNRYLGGDTRLQNIAGSDCWATMLMCLMITHVKTQVLCEMHVVPNICHLTIEHPILWY